MKKIFFTAVCILASVYVANSVADSTTIMTEPLVFVSKPDMPLNIVVNEVTTATFTIKNEVDDPHTSLPIYPSILPGSSQITRINIGNSGDCGPNGTDLKGGDECTLTYQITATSTPENINQTLSIEYKGRYPLTTAFNVNFNAWEKTSNTPGQAATWALALDNTTQTLFAGNVNYTDNGVYSLDLTDDTATWQAIGSLNKSVTSLLFDSTHRILYAGLIGGTAGVFSYDFTAQNPSWVQVGTNSPGSYIGALALDPSTSTLYASDVNSNWVQAIVLSAANPAWVAVGQNAPSTGAYGLLFDANTNTLYAGASSGFCPPQTNSGVYSLAVNTPNASWIQMGSAAPGNGEIGNLVLHDQTLYAGLIGNTGSSGGVYNIQTTSNSATWQTTGTNPTPYPGAGLVQGLISFNSKLYAGTGIGFCGGGNNGVWFTDLSGTAPWAIITNVGYPTNTSTRSLLLNPQTDLLYASTNVGVYQIQQ